MAKPSPLRAYPSEREFYASRGDRLGGGEVDYGCYWRWGSSRQPVYRVTYCRETGELYVMQFGGRMNGRIEVHGHCSDFTHLEQVLAGWAEASFKPRSLPWLVERLRAAGLDRYHAARVSPLGA